MTRSATASGELMTMMSDLRQAWRTIWRMPGLAAVVIVSLGVGIGVNTAVFSWIQAMVLQPLPGVADAGGVQLVEPRADTGSYPGVSWLEYRDLRERLRTLPDLFAFRMVPFNVGETGRSERTYGLLVSGNYFSALGPASRRSAASCAPDEVDARRRRAGRRHLPRVLADALRRRAERARPDAARQRSPADDRRRRARTVPGHRDVLAFDLWVPATMAPALLAGSRELEDRGQRGYSVAGRLAPRRDAHARRRPSSTSRCGSSRTTIPRRTRRSQARCCRSGRRRAGRSGCSSARSAILQGVMLLLLLAVCGNTANLMLARASARQREIGVRLALGAGPWRVVSLLLTENLLLALLGAALGAAIAVWATDALRAVPMIGSLPVKFQTSVDGVGLAFALGARPAVRR